jgi:hypothetical protein
VAIDADAVEAEAARRLASDPAIPDGYELVDGTVRPTLGEPTVADGSIHVEATVEASALPQLDPDAIRAAVEGLTETEAELALASLGEAEVTLWPGWVTTVPELDWRVEIEIAEPAQP